MFQLFQVQNPSAKFDHQQKIKGTYFYLLIVFLGDLALENLTLLTNRKTQIATFSGATSKEILHYLGTQLNNLSANSIILQVGVNKLLEKNYQSSIENLREKNEDHGRKM